VPTIKRPELDTMVAPSSRVVVKGKLIPRSVVEVAAAVVSVAVAVVSVPLVSVPVVSVAIPVVVVPTVISVPDTMLEDGPRVLKDVDDAELDCLELLLVSIGNNVEVCPSVVIVVGVESGDRVTVSTMTVMSLVALGSKVKVFPKVTIVVGADTLGRVTVSVTITTTFVVRDDAGLLVAGLLVAGLLVPS
jgi:hypothetical protein